jgi:hypothetical protein
LKQEGPRVKSTHIILMATKGGGQFIVCHDRLWYTGSLIARRVRGV